MSPITVTPGILFIGRNLLPVVLATASIAGIKHLGTRFNVAVPPTWILILASALFVPVSFAVSIIIKDISDRRAAAAMGARTAPRVLGRLPGNLDSWKRMLNHFAYGYLADGFSEVIKEFGPVVNMRFLWEDRFFTVEPDHIKLILATDFNNYVKGPRFTHNMSALLGTGVFNSDGEMWKFHRSMTRPFFSKDRISHFELFDRHAEIAITQMKKRLREGYAVDFQDLMSRFTLDSATEFLFGSCVHSLSAGLPYPHNASELEIVHTSLSPKSEQVGKANDFARAFLEAQQKTAQRQRVGTIWPLFEIFGDQLKEPMEVVNSYLDPIIKDAVGKQELKKALGDTGKEDEDDLTLLDSLVKFTSDPVVLKDETLNIMLAGRDTTAATLTFVIYCLSQNNDIVARLREEILAKVGPSRRPTYEDIKDMKYLRAVLNETLRLYPVVPFNVRETIHATTWPSANPLDKPIYIPANSMVPYSVFLMHRRKDLWGPDAEQFDPDRFIDYRLKKYLTPNPFIFLPFNAGPRICLGQQFAYNEMSFMLIRLFQNFSSVSLDRQSQPPDSLPPSDWVNAGGRKSVEEIFPKSHLTMYTLGGLWINMNEADNSM